MQAARPAILVHDRAGAIIGWNEQAMQLLGYSAPEVIGKSLSLIIGDSQQPDDATAVRVCKTKDARLLRVLWRSSELTDGADGVLASTAVLTPIEAVAPERALHASPLFIKADEQVQLLESIALLLWTSREGGQVTFLNGRLRDYAGASALQSQAVSWLELLHSDDRESVRRQWQTCCEHATDFRSECRLRRHDGSFRWFDVRGAARDDAQHAGEWCFSGADVDDTHALHAQLRADQERLRSIMESSPGVVISYHIAADGMAKVTFVSSAAREVYGYSPEEIEMDASLIVRRIHEGDALRTADAITEAQRTGQPWHGEFRYEHPVEGEKWLEPHFSLGSEPDGRVVWNGIVLDITKRKHDEEQLTVVQTQLEAAIEAAQMGVWIFDVDKGQVWGNERQRKLWGIPSEVPSWYPADLARTLIHPDDLPRVDGEMARAMVTGEPLEMEFRLLTANDRVQWVSMRSQTESHPDGRPRRLMGINVDITRRKLLAEAALRSQKLEALGTLAGGIAHDFNNVLFAISGNAALALDRVAKTSATHRFLQVIASASARASELVRQILTFSRPQDQKLEVLELADPVREALRLARATLPSMMAIQTELDPHTPAVLADASHMVQVVLNLCTNAAHAIGKGNVGLIELRVEPVTIKEPPRELGKARVPNGTYAVLSVSDNGCGMDEQTQTRIFDPFFTTKAPGEGTGLGLSMVHGIVTALGGAITVYSQVGKGSTFRLYLPVTDQALPAVRPMTARRFGRGQEILLVDDEPMIMELGREMLVTLGYRPTAFDSARDALAAFRREPRRFVAVVTDLSMPNMSGFDLARELLALRSDPPILLMSGYIGPDERASAARIGVREIALKPLSMERLSELIADLCLEA